MIVVTGAKGVVGAPLCVELSRAGRQFIEVSRQGSPENTIKWDLSLTAGSQSLNIEHLLEGATCLIHCAPIWLLPSNLSLLKRAGITQIVVFSSTSVLSKRNSENKVEQQLVSQLASSENAIIQFCCNEEIDLTILRPSLIYGYGRDQNVSHIARFIRRYKFMILVGEASGLRQPVHADDLVSTALTCLNKPSRRQVAYNLAGRDILTYKQKVERIFTAISYNVRIVAIPLTLFRLALVCANKIGRFSYTAEMADRMSQNLDYDYSDAARDLAFTPQGFLEVPERDILK